MSDGKQVYFRATVTFEYHTALEGSEEAYGTADVNEMAEVDREQMEDTDALFMLLEADVTRVTDIQVEAIDVQ